MSSTEPVVAQSNLSPASNTQGAPVQARLFKITDIPAAMDAIDWPVSAALMRHWFQGLPWPTETGGMSQRVKEHAEWPAAQYIEESIVKMSWVASFDKVQPVLAELRRSWNNTAAMGEIRKHLLTAYGDKGLGCYPLVFPNLASAVALRLLQLTRDHLFQVGQRRPQRPARSAGGFQPAGSGRG